MTNSTPAQHEKIEQMVRSIGPVKEVAAKLGISHVQLHRLMKGTRRPSLATLERLTSLSGQSLDWARSEELGSSMEVPIPQERVDAAIRWAELGMSLLESLRTEHRARFGKEPDSPALQAVVNQFIALVRAAQRGADREELARLAANAYLAIRDAEAGPLNARPPKKKRRGG